ncbi:MAG: DUF1573 domain-containing protein [Bacteroidales bacterium]|jgi:hypothetical protein|nr:DUF1573 domain-containing protein [Bacteroidales bacterium]
MKKILFSVVLVAAVASVANAQTPQRVQLVGTPTTSASNFTPSVEGPEIQFEKTLHDYGQVVQGANGDIEFKFKNIGSEPLLLFNVQPSCNACLTITSWPREPIASGQEAVIKVNYNTTILGPMGKNITVYSNGKSERIALRIAGNVNPK